jgi:hypothetical protein
MMLPETFNLIVLICYLLASLCKASNIYYSGLKLFHDFCNIIHQIQNNPAVNDL